ncbi:MAG: hypothetical protein NG740_05395 [Omnitrophica bacterium]|nr:hypothetical protein [Candidatus Omnitrophota bacterium]
MKRLCLIGLSFSILFSSVGCNEVTYPKATLRESIIKLCRDEYDLNVDVTLSGKTLALYMPLMNLFGATLSLSEEAQDKIQDVILGASRITLSTDADIKFYCIITQDVRIPEIQLVIIKYVDDIKRAFYSDISRGEYFKRTLIDMSENPQAKKEKAITDVLDKMELDQEMRDKVLDDFFRSEPGSLDGIGYWNGKFYIKNITFEEFLAEQIASRIRMRFSEEESLNRYDLKLVTGNFAVKDRFRFFLISFSAESLLFTSTPDERALMEDDIFKNIINEISNVVYGYKFRDFNLVKIEEKNYSTELAVSKEDIYLFKRGKLGINTILSVLN